MAKKQHPLKELKREKFCQLYAGDREFFGNGVQSYLEAYNIDMTKKGQYDVARVQAYRLLTNVSILERIDEILDFSGFTNAHADKQLMLVMTQNANLSAKIKGLGEYNKLRGRHKPTKVEHTGPEGEPIQVNILDYRKAPKIDEPLPAGVVLDDSGTTGGAP